MLYVAPSHRKSMYKMYKVLRAISCGEEVEVGDVVLSYIYDNNSVYFQIGDKKQYHFFSLDEGEPKGFNKWFEEIEYAYYYDSEEKRVRSIDIEEAHNLNLDDRKECFADEDKALELLEEDKNINLPKNLEFKTFATSYIPNLYGEHSEYSSEPLEIRFDDMKFLLAVDWHRHNLQELENILSEKVFNSYVEKIWLDQEDNRIGVTLTSSKYRD